MKVKVKKLSLGAIIPKYATAGAACFDIHADFSSTPDFSAMLVGDTVRERAFKTGLTFEVPENHVMLVFSRSGHGFKNNVRLSNCTGIIDSDYRGELAVKLRHDGGAEPIIVCHGDRIAQAMILPINQVEFVEVDELSSTERGAGGFGSTGQQAKE